MVTYIDQNENILSTDGFVNCCFAFTGTEAVACSIRNEIIRLTNEVRKENGVSELSVDSAMMNAAQAAAEYYAMSGDGWNGHNLNMEDQCEKWAGATRWSLTNLTGISSGINVASRAITNWKNSSGHFQSMIDSWNNVLGVGVAKDANGYYWCVQAFGI